jgi:phosphoglycolate phosphatase-like HAD superfamily hydrolase
MLALFDIDGTLIESSKVHVHAFSRAFLKVYGVNASIDMIEHHGMTDPEIAREVLMRSGLAGQMIESKFRDCMKMLVESFNELADENGVVPLDGVRELLEALKKRYVSLGLVTGNLEAIAREKLKRIHLDGYFHIGAFGSDQMRRADLVRLAITRAQIHYGFEFSNVFLFGDTPRDMEAGKESGVRTVGVSTGIYSREQLKRAGADFLLKDLSYTDAVLEILFPQAK